MPWPVREYPNGPRAILARYPEQARRSAYAMPIPLSSIRLGCCYATALDDVRKVIEISSRSVTYVARGKLAFPTWDKNQWRTTTKEAFAYEVVSEVPCDWQPK